MRDTFHAVPLVGGMALTAFTLLMAAARLYAGPFVDRVSPRAVVTALLALAAIGLVAVWLAPHPAVAIAGFGLLGIGCSAVYPLAISAAAQRTDRPSAVNVASVSQMSFVVFFLGPPLLGGVAQWLGIRNSYLVCLPVVLVGLMLVPALSSRPRPLPPGETPPEPLSAHG
jgi:MFS family permease